MPENRPIRNPLDPAERLAEVERLALLGTAAWDAVSDTVEASAQMRRNYDIALDLPLRRGMLLDCVHPDDRERVEALTDEARGSGQRIAFEHRVIHASGEVRHLACTAQIFLENGAPRRSFATAQDVTTLRLSEEAQAREGRQLADAEVMAALGSWELDLDTWAATWSENLFRLYGVDPGTTMPSFDAFRRLLHPDDEEETVRLIRAGIGAHEDVEYECRVVRPDGMVRMFRQRHRVIRDDDGRPVRVVGIGQDVTDEHRERETLLRLKAIVEASNDAIIGIAPDGTVESWNAGAERATGWASREMIGHAISEVVAPEAPPRPPTLVERVGRGENVVDVTRTIVSRDGRRMNVLVSGWPIRDGAGHVIGASIIARGVPRDAGRPVPA
jgi:PAS domain S-box-containing protein